NGRNILIAGGRAGRLIGGVDEDILIGGYTAWDTNAPMLDAIMAQWTRTDLDYLHRINLLFGSYLNPMTVHSNGGGNTLLGGPGLDWFVARIPGDFTDRDPMSGEQLVPIF